MDFRLQRQNSPGGIRFLFDCGQLPDAALASIRLQAEEFSDYRLVGVREALPLLRKPIRRRVRAVRKQSGAPRKHALVYLEDSRPPARLIRIQANAAATGASRSTSSGPARSGSETKPCGRRARRAAGSGRCDPRGARVVPPGECRGGGPAAERSTSGPRVPGPRR